ncbi:MAG: DUF4412 domain-containing protein [Dehalococcoidales bacterium]|jgi:outer membrane lipoprotein-sorting protein
MKNRHLLIIVGALMALVFILSSCGGGGSPTSSTPPKTTSPAGTTAPAGTTSPASTTSPTTSNTGNDNTLADILGKGSDLISIKYDMTINANGEQSITATVYQKNRNMREDMSMSGMSVIMIFNTDDNVMYIYYPDQKMAIKQALNEDMVPAGNLQDTSDIMDYSPNVTGTETIDGHVCAVVYYEQPGAGSVKMWIWEEKGFPVKMETTTSSGTTTIEFTNISFSDIPDSTFELPDDVQIQEY